MDSLETYGAVEPAVFNRTTGEVVGGHMRVQAARVLGWETYPTVFVDLDRDNQRLLNLALNRISGEWDEDMLAEVLWELKESGSDLGLSGFEEGELEKLLKEVGPTDRDGKYLASEGWAVVIDCTDEAEQTALLHRLDAEGLRVRPLML
jgi:ParB-like chromosome segregation protein Spo0J